MPRKAKSVVAITRGSRAEATKALQTGLDLLGGARRFVKKGAVVILKPNLGYPEADGQPAWTCTTDCAVLAGLTEIFLGAGAKKVITADGPAHGITGQHMLESTGIKAAVEKVGGIAFGLDEDDYLLRKVPGGIVLREQWLPRTLLEADLIVNVPKVKPTRVGKWTLAYKNMFGVVPADERFQWHRIPEHFYFLVDLYRLLPYGLTVMDGLVMQEGLGPRFGTRVDWGVLIMGRDPVATEAATVMAIGHEPYEQMVLPVAAKAGQGTMSIENIEVRGETIDAVKRYTKVAPGDYWLHDSPNVQEYCGGVCWGCGLWMQYTPYPWEIDATKTYALVVGTTPRVPERFQEDEVIVLGNCAARSKRQIQAACQAAGIEPTYVGGCPPYAQRKHGYLQAHRIEHLPYRKEKIKRVKG